MWNFITLFFKANMYQENIALFQLPETGSIFIMINKVDHKKLIYVAEN